MPTNAFSGRSRWILAVLLLICGQRGWAEGSGCHLASPSVASTQRAAGPTNRAAGSAAPDAQQGWVLTSTAYQPLDFVQQPFVGNGYLGLRIPAIGQGYQGGNLGKAGFPLFNDRYTAALVAGLYENTKRGNRIYPDAGPSDYIASLSTWSEMDLAVGPSELNAFTPAGRISHYRQSVNMRDALVTTSFTWRAAPRKTVDVCTTVLANRARMHLGEVRLIFRPSWTGTIALSSLLNGRGAERITATGRKIDTDAGLATITFTTPGRNTAAVETELTVAGQGTAIERSRTIEPPQAKATAGLSWTIPVVAGGTYEVTKYVGISTANDPGIPGEVAAQTAREAARTGWRELLDEHKRAWAKLWSGDIEAPHGKKLQNSIHSSFYLLYSSIRAGLDWSIPPAGLSSDNYGGEIFWDADTWMFPTLLAFHPQLARSIVDFRYRTLTAAWANAKTAGYRGAMWAWDDGPTGACGGLAPCSHYEDHLQSDIALAQWEYYEATGDRQWLADRGFPVIEQVADFWISRVRLGKDGKYHIDGVTGPDEFTAGVNDESSTNAGAIMALRDAVMAARALGRRPNPQWSRVADNIAIMVSPDGSHPEYRGYAGQTVKQADTVLMTYPFRYVTDPEVAAKDLDRYMAVTGPGGPAMTASVESIIAARIRRQGCLDYTLMLNSYLPFIRGSYDQFLETQYLTPSAGQGPPAFNFATGAGGFLQIFPFGFAGLDWSTSSLQLAPTLPPQLKSGITLTGVRYQGRSMTIRVEPQFTRVTLDSGEPLRLQFPGGTETVAPGHRVELRTFMPDIAASDNLALCRPTEATSAARANPPAAAVDGNLVTSWQAQSDNSSLTIVLSGTGDSDDRAGAPSSAVIHWAATRPETFNVSLKTTAGTWHKVAAGRIANVGMTTIRWPAEAAHDIRFNFSGSLPASITELEIRAGQ